MSGTKAFTFEIKRNGRKPQVVNVVIDEESRQFLFGPDVSEQWIVQQLPRLIMDAKFKPKRKAAA